MPFATSTIQKIAKYLGFPVQPGTAFTIQKVLDLIEVIPADYATYREDAIATIEGYLATLDTLAAAIIAEAQLEGSTLLPELRREYRRHVGLVAALVGLEPFADTTGGNT